MNANINVNVQLEDLVRVVQSIVGGTLDAAGNIVKQLLSASSTVQTQTESGGKWISLVDGTMGFWSGHVVSAYYHQTKKHTATTVGKLGTQRSVANPGEWAVSIQTKAMWGNKTFYNTL